MKTFLKRFTAVALGLGISLAGAGIASASNLTWSADHTIALTSPANTMYILSGSQASSLVVNPGNIQVVVGNGDVFQLKSPDKKLVVTGITSATQSTTCVNGANTVTLTGTGGNETITLTPGTNACNFTTGGGSSGSTGAKPPVTPSDTTTAHTAGSVVKTSDGTVWFITTDGYRRAFTSGGAFLSYGFLNFGMVADANTADQALPTGSFIPPQDGKLICSDRDDSVAKKGTCYLITAGKRAAFTSSAVFTGQGFSFANSTKGDVSFMATAANISSSTAAHLPGVLVNNKGTIQLVGPSGLMGIPTPSVFTSWGYSYADVVPANTADKAMTQSGVMQSRVTGQLSPQ